MAHASQQEPLSVADMLARASAETGLHDFGDEEFNAGLDRLIDCMNRNIVLSPLGRTVLAEEVHGYLVNRLRFAADLKRHPEILDEQIDDPVIILGMPRTGTTKLHRLLAADPSMQSPKVWQMLNPAPTPGALTVAGEDPRIEQARKSLDALAQLSPGLMQSHPQSAEYPEEEIYLHMFTFHSESTLISNPAPGYGEWLAGRSLRGTYRFMKQMLQYLQWQDGARVGNKRGRRWMLKSPTHLGRLDLVEEIFPRAQYVFVHRDLGEVMPSFCRLVEMAWRLKTDDVDPHAVGRFMLDIWSSKLKEHLHQARAMRERIGEIYDVYYEDIKNDPIAVARDIYRHLGIDFTPAVEAAMREWDAKESAYGSLGHYRYTLEQYGLTREAIAAAFDPYIGHSSRPAQRA